MARGVVILECPRIPQSEVWARSYGVLNGALPRDNAQLCECFGEGQHTPRSDARESRLFGGGVTQWILARMEHMRNPSASMQRVDANGVVAR